MKPTPTHSQVRAWFRNPGTPDLAQLAIELLTGEADLDATRDLVFAANTKEHLALYTGTGGPISFTLHASGLSEATFLLRAVADRHYIHGSNELELPMQPSHACIARALRDDGWEETPDHVMLPCGSAWELYTRRGEGTPT